MKEEEKTNLPRKVTMYEEKDLKIVGIIFRKFALLNTYAKEIGGRVESYLDELRKYDLASYFEKAKVDRVPILWYGEERAKGLGYPISDLPISANTVFLTGLRDGLTG